MLTAFLEGRVARFQYENYSMLSNTISIQHSLILAKADRTLPGLGLQCFCLVGCFTPPLGSLKKLQLFFANWNGRLSHSIVL